MARTAGGDDNLLIIAQLLRNLLAIELWRSGLSQAEIGKRLGIATGSVNTILKGVGRSITTKTGSEE